MNEDHRRSTLRDFVVAALTVLGACAAGQAVSEEIPENCPSKREWTSVIDPENRPVFYDFTESVLLSEPVEGPDRTRDADRVMQDNLRGVDQMYALLIHSYQDNPDYREQFSTLFTEFRKNAQIRERYGDDALRELAQCMEGGQGIDCAKMAVGNGYVKTLDELSTEESFKDVLGFFKDVCQIK